MAFRGISTCSIDAKGRFAVPAKYRALLGAPGSVSPSGCVITLDAQDPCLLLYTQAEWQAIEEKVQALPSLHAAARRLQRLLIGHATDVELDAGGRVVLPAMLREHAGITKKCILVGQGKKFEIWSEERWELQRQSLFSDDGVNEVLSGGLDAIVL